MQVVRKISRASIVVLFVLLVVVARFRVAAAFREHGVPDKIAPAGGRFVQLSNGRIFVQERGRRVGCGRKPPPIPVGYFYGGGPAAEFSLREPGRLRKPVLVDAALGISDAPKNSLPVPLRSQALREVLVNLTASNPLITRRILVTFIYRKDRAIPKYVAILSRPLTKRDYTPAVARWLPRPLSVDAHALSAREDSWRQLDLPVQILWGDEDTVSPLAQAEHIAELLPKSRLTVLLGVGHIP